MTDLIDKIERLSAAATPGEWVTAPDHMGDQDYETCIERPGRAGQIGAMVADFHHNWEEDRISWKAAQGNAALAVTLRNAVPELLSALRAQQHAEALADVAEHLTAFVEQNYNPLAILPYNTAPARAVLAAYRSVK